VFELTEEHFKDPATRSLFASMRLIYDKGMEITPHTIQGHRDALCALQGQVKSADGIKTHCQILKENLAIRKTHAKITELANGMAKKRPEPGVLAAELESCLLELIDCTEGKGLRHIDVVGQEVFEDIDQIIKGKETYVSTGFRCMDSRGWYFRNGTMNVIAARPGMGKTAFAMDVAINCRTNVAFFSVEMRDKDIYERVLARYSGIGTDEMKSPKILKMSMQTIIEARGEISKKKIWIDDNAGKTPMQILSQCKRLMHKDGLGLIIVDYIGILGLEKKTASRREQITEISHQLVSIAKTLNVPIVVLSQLNRECEKRDDKRPILQDLRESGDIEQDAQQVWMLYRDAHYDPTFQGAVDDVEVISRKNRSGKIGLIKLHFDRERTHFYE
jgi:replicative DNA helicase